jgi:leucyl aminopeptidase
MLFSTLAQFTKRKPADALVIPFWEKHKKAKAAFPLGDLEKELTLPLEDFFGKEGEMLLFYKKDSKEKRCLLLGLGKEESLSIESLRKAYSSLVRFCHKKQFLHLNVLFPDFTETRGLSAQDSLKGICEGFLLTNYRWNQKSEGEDQNSLLKTVSLIGVNSKFQSLIHQLHHTIEGVYLARDLINGNADIVTPSYLAETAKMIAEKLPAIKTTVFNKEQIEEEKMGLLLAVGRGSPNEPVLITLNYKGNPQSKDHTVLVGKGITFDTGGLNLKPTGSMETMRDDMSGAAAVMGTLASVAAMGLKVNVTGVIASAENAIDGKSFKPGDVYKSYKGKTVEIGNTDAEGRLILADALAYSVKNLSPSRIIDLATLTGAMVIALGEEMSGFMTNNDQIAEQLMKASEGSSELLWRLPLFPPYKENLKSDIADIKNIGGKAGSSILAALFLEEFVDQVPWAHIDIAGTAFSSKERYYWPKNAVGFGVRLLIEFLQILEKQY